MSLSNVKRERISYDAWQKEKLGTSVGAGATEKLDKSLEQIIKTETASGAEGVGLGVGGIEAGGGGKQRKKGFLYGRRRNNRQGGNGGIFKNKTTNRGDRRMNSNIDITDKVEHVQRIPVGDAGVIKNLWRRAKEEIFSQSRDGTNRNRNIRNFQINNNNRGGGGVGRNRSQFFKNGPPLNERGKWKKEPIENLFEKTAEQQRQEMGGGGGGNSRGNSNNNTNWKSNMDYHHRHYMSRGHNVQNNRIPVANRIETTKLLLSNIQFNIQEKDIRELFSQIGPLRQCSLDFDISGRSMGTGSVVYEYRTDAMKAIEKFSNILLDGQPLTIQMVRPDDRYMTTLSSGVSVTFGNNVIENKPKASNVSSPVYIERIVPATAFESIHANKKASLPSWVNNNANNNASNPNNPSHVSSTITHEYLLPKREMLKKEENSNMATQVTSMPTSNVPIGYKRIRSSIVKSGMYSDAMDISK